MSKLRDLETRVFDRVNPLVRFSVTRYVLAIGLFVAVVAFGLISTFTLGVDQFPEVKIPYVVITTTYPGATPSVMDEQVTKVIEDSVSTLSGLTDINSYSFAGTSEIVLAFDLSVPQSSAADQVSAQVASAVRGLPNGAQSPIVQSFDPTALPILQFGVAGGSADLATVSDYVKNDLTPLLVRVPGVANVKTDGAPDRAFTVYLNPNRLHYYHLNPQNVVSAIATSAVNQPIGSIVVNGSTLSFSTQKLPADVAQISRIVVDTSRNVTVGDVATVRDGASASNIARINGQPVVLASVQKTSGSNAVAVANAVRELLSNTQLPTGYQVLYGNDTTAAIKAAVNSTERELWVTVLVVGIIVLLFLGRLNTVLSVVLAVPIAISAAPVLYNLLGYTFNLISLLALIVAVGVVVDDSIVVAENVARYRAMGFSLKDSVLRGASEVFSAVVAATLSLLAVLLPVSFLPGIIGLFLRQFALGLAAAVAFSLLEAVLFLTVRLAYTPENDNELNWRTLGSSFRRFPESFRWGLRAWRKPAGIVLGVVALLVLAATKHFTLIPGIILYPILLGVVHYLGRIVLNLLEALTDSLHRITESGVDWIRDGYTRLLRKMLRASGWVITGSVVIIIVLAIIFFPRISFSFVPQSDSGTMDVNLSLAPGTPLSTTNREASLLENYLLQQPGVQTVQTVVGSTGAVSIGAAQSQNATLNVQLVPISARPGVYKLITEYRKAMQSLISDFPTAQLVVSASGGFQGQGSSLNLNIISSNLDTLTTRSVSIVAALKQYPYVQDVVSSLGDTSAESDFVPDDTNIAGTGISPQTVAGTLLTYTSGQQAATAQIGGKSYPINVQVDPTYLNGAQSLLGLPVYSPTLQKTLQIGQLGNLVINRAPVSIERYNRLYTAKLSINLEHGAPPALSLQNQFTERLQKAGLLGNGVTLSSGGTFSGAALAKQLAVSGPVAFLLAFFLAYLVMAAQFNSWRYPIYLLSPVPLAIVGALLFVSVLGGELDVFGVLGLLLLIGLSAKNAILYLDFVIERIGRMPLLEALVEAARLRFRPIVMTTLTVLVISGPLVFAHGVGSEFGQRLGVVMFGGIVFSAILTFFVVPAAFFFFERKRVDAGKVPVTAISQSMSTLEIEEDAGRERDDD